MKFFSGRLTEVLVIGALSKLVCGIVFAEQDLIELINTNVQNRDLLHDVPAGVVRIVSDTDTTLTGTDQGQKEASKNDVLIARDQLMNYQFDIDAAESHILKATSTLRSFLQKKNITNVNDAVTVASEKWINFSQNILDEEYLKKRIQESRAFYGNSESLKQGVKMFDNVYRYAVNETDWEELFVKGKKYLHNLTSSQMFVKLKEQNKELIEGVYEPNVTEYFRDVWRYMEFKAENNSEILELKNNIDTRIRNVLQKRPSRTVETRSPKPGNSPHVIRERNLSSKNTEVTRLAQHKQLEAVYLNVTEQNVTALRPTRTKDESSGRISYHISSWSIMGAVIIAVSSVVLF